MLPEAQLLLLELTLTEAQLVTLLVPVELLLWHTEAVKLELTVLQLERVPLRLGELLTQPLALAPAGQLGVVPAEALRDTVAQLLLEMEPLKEEDSVALLVSPVLPVRVREVVKEGLMEAEREREPEAV
jgi:hypothetical protein